MYYQATINCECGAWPRLSGWKGVGGWQHSLIEAYCTLHDIETKDMLKAFRFFRFTLLVEYRCLLFSALWGQATWTNCSIILLMYLVMLYTKTKILLLPTTRIYCYQNSNTVGLNLPPTDCFSVFNNKITSFN